MPDQVRHNMDDNRLELTEFDIRGYMAESENPNDISVGFIALGCPKNLVDSEKMLAKIGQAGFMLTDDPDNADVVVINTCGFIEPAKKEALDVISQAYQHKKNGNIAKIIVTGCLPQRIGKKLLKESKGIDAIVGIANRDNIAEIIWETISKPAGRAKTYLETTNQISDDRERLLITGPHWAYLRISQGCNRKCSFCTIPIIRGPFRSKPMDMIISEASELVDSGVVELNIVAQDSTRYGTDINIAGGLRQLIKELEKIEKLKWIRLMYLYPANITAELIEAIAESKKVVNYIDMPIQHINNDILKAMHRADREDKTIALIENLRKKMPDVVLRTTIITGFPGESEKQFDQLLDFVEWAKFDALGCFPFYQEQGTVAAELPGQIPDKIKQGRADELMLTQQEIAFEKAKQRIGQNLTCLVDHIDRNNNIAQGRFYGQAPEIDSLCVINNCKSMPGNFIKTNVKDSDQYDLIVEQVFS